MPIRPPLTWTGTAGDDYYAYSLLDNFLGTGLEGNDTIIGNVGNDYLNGGHGNDYLAGGNGDDFFEGGIGNDYSIGGNGNDFFDGGIGNDTLIGGQGDDTYLVDSIGDIVIEDSFSGSDSVKSSVNYSLDKNIEDLRLSKDAHRGVGNRLDNAIFCEDTSFPGVDNFLFGARGNDILEGNLGSDTLIGGRGDDVLYAFDRANFVYGYDGNNVLWGGSGNDTLWGNQGNDILNGGRGNDYLRAFGDFPANFEEYDTFTGGAGADIFALLFRDKETGTLLPGGGYATITDFKRYQGDKIEVVGSNVSEISGYSLDKSLNLSGTSAIDTGIYYLDSLIAVVQDTTNVFLAVDFHFQ
jgi:Ca2+-binding RTX toxin-like protein